ncbi:hypothetical protein CPB86DRAFT_728623 [Serendipita vermifera]|nr:hypothetical protein CPB86DRAFT_807882 [Serendipita vermifera]PVG00976.1 hypothetical protein CPB86DRAFT_728623 [Serendipita vermifera]
MGDRETLISMGFSPDRVDWAIRDTPANSDMQTRLDHIIDHDNQPVPPPNLVPAAVSPSVSSPTGSFSSIFAPPSQPPPTRTYSTQQQPVYAPPPTLPPRTPRTEDLAQTVQTLSLTTPLSPPNTNATVQKPEIENQAVQRYSEFLESHRNTLSRGNLDNDSAKAFYTSLLTFLDTEKEVWRAQLDLPVETAPPVVVNTVSRETVTVQPTQPVPTTVPPIAPVAEEINGANTTTTTTPEQPATKSSVYDPIAVYDPNRTLLPVSPPLGEVVGKVITAYYEDEPVEAAIKRARLIRPRMTEQISDKRWSATIGAPQDDESRQAFQRRSEAHYSHQNELYNKGDWEGAQQLDEEYQRNETVIRQQENRKRYEKHCETFLNPAREQINAAFVEIHPIYAELQRFLEEENWELDVVRAVRALEEASDIMEAGMKELETLEDDRGQREFELQREIITDDKSRSDPYGDANKLEAQKNLHDLELKASRTSQKLERRAAFYALAMRRMGEAIAGVDKDATLLFSALQELLATIPESIPLQQEEERKAAGDDAPSKVPLPSKELCNQISQAQSSLYSINEMRNDMHEVLRNLQRKQMAEKRENDLAQLALNETRAGRGDNWYFNAGSAQRDQAEKEDETTEAEYSRARDERRAKFNEEIEPISTLLRKYRDREMLALTKLAGGMTANGSMESGSDAAAAAAAAGGGSANAALAAMQQMMRQQQQTQMISNMMWSQHATTMSVINNIGSSNSQWVVKYY